MSVLEVLEFAISHSSADRRRSHRLLYGALLYCIAGSSSARQQAGTSDLPASNPALRQQLVAMEREDQTVRIDMMRALKKQGISFGDGNQLKDPKLQKVFEIETEKLTAADKKHRQRLKQIIKEHGWPGKSLAGREGGAAAWLIVQHSDADVKFQRRCLKLLASAPAGEVEAQHVAYLTDRVLVNENKPQRYGTQMGDNFKPRPIENPEKVDQRRTEVGLPPLAEYLRGAKEAYEKMASGETDSNELDR
jgi:hypothetical protein